MPILRKQCKRCSEFLPIDNFYKHKGMTDGYLSFCKSCTKARVRKYRAKNLEKIHQYDINRPNMKERREKQKENRKFIPKEKTAARNAISKALMRGKMTKPDCCSSCGISGVVIEGHHENYAKPLDVVWLCKKCHGEKHRKFDYNEHQKEQTQCMTHLHH